MDGDDRDCMARKLLSFLCRLLLSRLKPSQLRHLIWRKRRLQRSSLQSQAQGSLFLHPLALLSRGLLNNQIVQVFISYQTKQGITKHCERLFRVRSLSGRISPNEFIISADDVINLFGTDVVTSSEIDCIRAYVSLPPSMRNLAVADAIRLAPIKQLGRKENEDYSNEMKTFVSTPRIVYKHDVISLVLKDVFTGQQKVRCFRVDCIDSPCIFDATSSVYETAPINTHLPHGAQAPPTLQRAHGFLPRPLHTVLERMTDLIVAFGSVSELPLVLLLSGSPGSGKRLLTEKLAANTHQNLLEIDCFDVWSEVPAQSEAKLRNAVERARSFQPCILHLTSIDVLGYDANSSEIDPRILSVFRSLMEEPAEIVVIMSCRTDEYLHLSPNLRCLALYEFSIEHLNEDDRLQFFSQRISDEKRATHAARHTAGFALCELFALLVDMEFRQFSHGPEDSLDWAIDKRNASFADAIGAPKIPCVSWDDVGGLEETKQLVIESIEGNLHGAGSSLKRSGIILFGPPGCGKTLIAKAVATEFKVAFLSVKGPELLNKYVGQSEENLRKVFERARQASPCVIFFDELDSLAPNRGRSGDSGGVMDRIVSQLLSELDSLHNSPQCKVFVMAATNRADLLDSSLLTPGRFDKVINVSPGSSVEDKTKILAAVSRGIQMEKDVRLETIAADCPDVMSGAELYSLVSSAAMNALREQVRLIESGRLQLKEACVAVASRHLENALATAKQRVAHR